jgi:hypothetical protein
MVARDGVTVALTGGLRAPTMALFREKVAKRETTPTLSPFIDGTAMESRGADIETD